MTTATEEINRLGDAIGGLLFAVTHEVSAQVKKHGYETDLGPSDWFVIASEEWGEVAKALVERDVAAAQAEIVQAIACLVRLSAALEGA